MNLEKARSIVNNFFDRAERQGETRFHVFDDFDSVEIISLAGD